MARTSRNSSLKETGRYLVEKLREANQPVITPYQFFRLIQEMYREGTMRSLRKDTVPKEKQFHIYYKRLFQADMIDPDPDYSSRLIRVRIVSSRPTEEIVCLADPLCHLSHLSAMQHWGLTNRSPSLITFSRPDRKTARDGLMAMMEDHPYPQPPNHFQLQYVNHPKQVRKREIKVTESRLLGDFVEAPDRPLRFTTIGQTFLDMLQRPELCGGMSHVLDVYDEHAAFWLSEIIATVNTCSKKVVKCRAGYILEERLGIQHKFIDKWKATAPQRGGSCKLDPSRDYAPIYSETWMLSLNV